MINLPFDLVDRLIDYLEHSVGDSVVAQSLLEECVRAKTISVNDVSESDFDYCTKSTNGRHSTLWYVHSPCKHCGEN